MIVLVYLWVGAMMVCVHGNSEMLAVLAVMMWVQQNCTQWL